MAKASEIFKNRLNEGLKGRGKKREFIKATGIEGPLMYRYLRGQSVPGIDQLEKIAHFFGWTASEMISGAEPPPRPKADLLAAFQEYLQYVSAERRDDAEAVLGALMKILTPSR